MKIMQYIAQIIPPNQINVPKDPVNESRLQQGFEIVLGVFAAAAVLVIAVCAFRIIISRGNSQDVSKARDGIIYASIGLVICMAAFFIVEFVVGNV